MVDRGLKTDPIIDFVHVALHKTASTWLQTAFFDRHPQIQMIGRGETKDLIVYTNAIWSTSDFDFDAITFRSKFEQILAANPPHPGVLVRGISHERLSGHMITGRDAYAIAVRLREIFGRVKVIVVLRHPMTFLRSVYNQYVKQGGALPFHRFVDDMNIIGRDLALKLDYGKLLAGYYRLFGRENVQVLPYELLVDDPLRFLRYICDFLGISHSQIDQAWAQKRGPNISFTTVSLAVMRFANYAGLKPRPVRTLLTRLDRRLLGRIFPPGPRFDLRDIHEYVSQNRYEGISTLLRDENYIIWEGELERYNYHFEDKRIS